MDPVLGVNVDFIELLPVMSPTATAAGTDDFLVKAISTIPGDPRGGPG